METTRQDIANDLAASLGLDQADIRLMMRFLKAAPAMKTEQDFAAFARREDRTPALVLEHLKFIARN